MRGKFKHDIPEHYKKVFVKCCFNCACCKWHKKYHYVCLEHKFRLGERVNRSPLHHVCNDWELYET